MALLFRRLAVVRIGTEEFRDLRVSFKAERSLGPTPSPAEVRVYGLDPDRRRAAVEAARGDGASVEVRAGYRSSELALIYRGDARRVRVELRGPDAVLVLQGADGLRALARRGQARAFARGTSMADVLRRAVTDSGLGAGNLEAAARAISGLTVGDGGLSLSGDPREALDAALLSGGLEWSAQDGQLLALRPDEALEGAAVDLSDSTGLVEQPSEDEKRELRATSLLNPSIIPGRLLRVSHPALTGVYRAHSVTYEGDTHGQAWYCRIRGRPF